MTTFNSSNVFKAIALGALLAASGFARAGEVGNGEDQYRMKEGDKDPAYGAFNGDWGFRIMERDDKTSKDYVDARLNIFKKPETFYNKRLDKKEAIVDKDAKEIEKELIGLIKQVAKIDNSTKITEATAVQKIPFWVGDDFTGQRGTKGSARGTEYSIRYIEFIKFKFQLDGESSPRFYHTMVQYRDQGPVVDEKADKNKTEEELQKRPHNFKTHTSVLKFETSNPGDRRFTDKDEIVYRMEER